jgi:hypothetical protein
MSVQERIMITKDEEEARLRREKKVWGVFPRLGGGGKSNNKLSTPTLPPSFGGVVSIPKKGEGNRSMDYVEDEDEDGVDQPRPQTDITIVPVKPSYPVTNEGLSASTLGSGSGSASASSTSLNIPKTAGFDFAAISRELGKNVDPSNGGVIRSEPVGGGGGGGSVTGFEVPQPPPLDRSGSAPPLILGTGMDRPDMVRRETSSVSGTPVRHSEETESWDSTTTTTTTIPDRQTPLRTMTNISTLSSSSEESTPSYSAISSRVPFVMANEWSAPAPATATASVATSSSSGGGIGKMAPPARPFPMEYLTTESGSSSLSSLSFGIGGLRRGDDDDGDGDIGRNSVNVGMGKKDRWAEAESNPW